MKKTVIGIITAAAVLAVLGAGCGRQEIQEGQERTGEGSISGDTTSFRTEGEEAEERGAQGTAQQEDAGDAAETEDTMQTEAEAETEDTTQSGAEAETEDMTQSGAETGTEDTAQTGTEAAQGVGSEPTYDKMWSRFYEKFYNGVSWEEIEDRLRERTGYYQASGYYEVIQDYWENTREVRDISNRTDPLYFADMKYYTAEDFAGVPPVVIHLAKNEIYAKHGYIFEDADLNNYFMGCAWYEPVYSSDEFDDGVFNDYERKNLELLAGLDGAGLMSGDQY